MTTTFDKGPRVLVAALITAPDGRLLLSRHLVPTTAPVAGPDGQPIVRRKAQGMLPWHFPDGELRRQEATVQALKRSLREDFSVSEDEISREQWQPCHVAETILTLSDTHYITLHYHVTVSDPLRLVARTDLEIRWMTPDEALAATTLESTRSTLVALRHLRRI